MDDTDLRLLERLLKPLEDRLDEHHGLLTDILKEGKQTNGNVIDHERRLKDLEAARDGEQTRRVRRGDRRRAWLEIAVGGVFVFMAGSEGPHVIHLIGRLF